MDTLYLARTLELAARGQGAVAPNPLVGCVIVTGEGRVLAEGYHRRFGGLHAEREAVATMADPKLVADATVYVSLEPCAHFGKQPPCADLLADLRPARVVAAIQDPNPLVAGQGFARLAAAGIETQTGPLQMQAYVQNRRFITRFWTGRPFVTLKWAQTADGFLARADFSSKWITGPDARRLAHRARARHQAIAVGYRTALYDDPALDTRLWPGPSPVRIVVDPRRALPATLRMFTDGGPTVHLYEGMPDEVPTSITGYHPLSVATAVPGGWPAVILDLLPKLGLHSLLVEGGTGLISEFTAAGLWDEALVFTAPGRFGPGSRPAPAPRLGGPLRIEPAGPDTASLYANPAAGFWPALHTLALPDEGPDWAAYL